jgi:transposase
MPKIIRVSLTPAQRAELQRRTHQRFLPPRRRERLEMVRLADRGWTTPQIAQHLGRHEQTVRKYLKAFLANGFDALGDRPVPGRPPRLTPTQVAALEQLLDESAASGRTWTVPQLVAWLHEQHGVTLSPGRLRVLLRTRRFRWKRTKRSLRHQQTDAALRAAKAADLEVLQLCRKPPATP